MAGWTATTRVPRILTAGALLIVAVAVGADLFVGRHTAHVAVMGAVALALGVVRVRAVGRHGPTFAAVSAVLVVPPALDVLSPLGADVGTAGSLHHLDADSATSLGHIALAATVALGVTVAEPLLRGLAAEARQWLRGLAVVGPPAPVVTRVISPRRAAPAVRRHPWARSAPRRGPPVSG